VSTRLKQPRSEQDPATYRLDPAMLDRVTGGSGPYGYLSADHSYGMSSLNSLSSGYGGALSVNSGPLTRTGFIPGL